LEILLKIQKLALNRQGSPIFIEVNGSPKFEKSKNKNKKKNKRNQIEVQKDAKIYIQNQNQSAAIGLDSILIIERFCLIFFFLFNYRPLFT